MPVHDTTIPVAMGFVPVDEGDALHLALAMAGRRAALDHLSGDGVETLRSR